MLEYIHLDMARQQPSWLWNVREFGLQDLERDFPLVLQVLGEMHGGHAAGAELTLDAVPIGEGIGEPGMHRVTQVCFTRRLMVNHTTHVAVVRIATGTGNQKAATANSEYSTSAS